MTKQHPLVVAGRQAFGLEPHDVVSENVVEHPTGDSVTFVTAGGQKVSWPIDAPTEKVLRLWLRNVNGDPIPADQPLPADVRLPEEARTGRSTAHIERDAARRAAARAAEADREAHHRRGAALEA